MKLAQRVPSSSFNGKGEVRLRLAKVLCLLISMLAVNLSYGSNTQKLPLSKLEGSLKFIKQIELEPGYWYWSLCPIEDASGKTHLFVDRWADGPDGMNALYTTSEIVHYVADSIEGPYTYVETILSNTNVPSPWMQGPQNVRIKKVDDHYVIVYTVKDSRSASINFKIGMLIAPSLNGPWTPVGPGGVVVEQSLTDPTNWTYNAGIGCDNPAFEKINGKYYVYFKAGLRQNHYTHYGYAVADNIMGPYKIGPIVTDNGNYLEDIDAFTWNGYEYALTTDNFGTDSGVFKGIILWQADRPNSPGPFHLANAQIAFRHLDDYTTIPKAATKAYGDNYAIERPTMFMQNGKPAYFLAPSSCNFLGTHRPGLNLFKWEADDELPLPPNLALGKQASASSLLDPTHTADKAIDNSLTTFWSPATGSGVGFWLEIDFGSRITFNQIVTREYSPEPQITGYKLQYFTGTFWADIMTGTTVGACKTDTFPTIKARKIRMLITAANGLPQIGEFQIFNLVPAAKP